MLSFIGDKTLEHSKIRVKRKRKIHLDVYFKQTPQHRESLCCSGAMFPCMARICCKPLTLNYILAINSFKKVFVVCPSPTSFCWVYPSGRYYRLSQSLIFPCTRYPSRSQVLFPWPASAVTFYLQLEQELGPVVGPLLSLFVHWRGGDEVNGR